MEFSNGATGTIYAVEEVSKPRELAKAAKLVSVSRPRSAAAAPVLKRKI